MSEQAERIRAAVDAYSEVGVDGLLDAFNPDVTWIAPPEWMDEPIYCGHSGMRDLDRLWKENFDDFGMRVEAIEEIGDRIVALCKMHGRIKAVGEPLEQRAALVMALDDEGRVQTLWAFFSWEEALGAARAAAA